MSDLTNLKSKDTLSVCRAFYEKYGADMIHRNFPQFENRIAVGLVGEGSECFGFDDEISRDHDFGLGFCMWLNTVDYQAIGAQLQNAYNDLIVRQGIRFASQVWGESISRYNPRIDQRRGVMDIAGFYGSTLKLRPDLDLILGKLAGQKLSELLCRVGLNVLLLQAWVPSSSYYFSINAVAWYLSTAFFSYFILML